MDYTLAYALRQRMSFDLIWNTGARINEALAVTPEDIVLDAPRPYVVLHTLKQRIEHRNGRPPKKNPVKRAIPLLDDALTIWRPSHDIRQSLCGTLPTTPSETGLMNASSTGCGSQYRPSLRHSFAMHLAMNGALPVTLQAYMGHRDFKSTQHYLKVFVLDVGIGRERGVQFTYPVIPFSASLRAVAFPIPLAPPVIRAT